MLCQTGRSEGTNGQTAGRDHTVTKQVVCVRDFGAGVQCWVVATLLWSSAASSGALAARCTQSSGSPCPSGVLMRR